MVTNIKRKKEKKQCTIDRAKNDEILKGKKRSKK